MLTTLAYTTVWISCKIAVLVLYVKHKKCDFPNTRRVYWQRIRPPELSISRKERSRAKAPGRKGRGLGGDDEAEDFRVKSAPKHGSGS